MVVMVVHQKPWNKWFLRWLLPRRVSVRLVTRKGKALRPMWMKVGIGYDIKTQNICFSSVNDCYFFTMVQLSVPQQQDVPVESVEQAELVKS